MCVNYLSGVDHGTSDQSASLLRSNNYCLSSAMGSNTGFKGITCCCCCLFFVAFFFVILFYFLSVISCSDIQRADKVVDCRHRIRVNVVLFCVHWSLAFMYLLHTAMLV